MSFEVGGERIPFRWSRADGREIASGLTLTEFAALDGGMTELVKMRRWCKRSRNYGLFEAVLIRALSQDHLYAEVRAIEAKLNAVGARRGRERYREACHQQELADRRVEYGLLPHEK